MDRLDGLLVWLDLRTKKLEEKLEKLEEMLV